MALPLAMGAGFGLETASKFGNEAVAKKALGTAGRYLKGWKASYSGHDDSSCNLHEYKAGIMILLKWQPIPSMRYGR